MTKEKEKNEKPDKELLRIKIRVLGEGTNWAIECVHTENIHWMKETKKK